MAEPGQESGAQEPAFDPNADILPDTILDKHFPLPAGRSAGAADDVEDTLGDEDLDASGEAADAESGDEELDEQDREDSDEEEDEEEGEDEDLEEDQDSDEAEDEEDDVIENVTAEERRAIDGDPVLRRLHKLMQRDYGRKTAAVADRERQIHARGARIKALEEDLQTPKGMVRLLTDTLQNHRDIVGAAFEAVATGEGAHDFLVEVGLHSPEVFQKAAERVQELHDDEDERGRHIRERDAKADRARLARERRELALERFDRQSNELLGEMLRFSRKLGIHKDDMADVRAAVIRTINEKTAKDGNIGLDAPAVRRLVKDAKKQIDSRLARVRRRLNGGDTESRREAVKRKATGAKKRPAVPARGGPGPITVRGSKREAARAIRGKKVPPGVDPLDFYIDSRLGR